MSRRRKGKLLDGVLILDKPQGVTSNAVLQRVRHWFGAAKAGHTGALDPLATGVLPICFGEATKFSGYLLNAEKAYRATARLGVTTNTGDSDGEVIRTQAIPVLDDAAFAAVLDRFRGDIQQVPSMFSALKHQGQPLYALARKGIEVTREARAQHISQLDLLARDDTQFTLEVTCSKGTYIRSLVEDIGAAMGCGAHVTALRRIRAGRFTLDDALSLDALHDALAQAAPQAVLLRPVDTLVDDLPLIRLNSDQAGSILQGQTVRIASAGADETVRLYDGTRFLGLGHWSADAQIKPIRLIRFDFNPTSEL